MVSLKIIDSAKFIKMPISSQALYFHLISRSDDDGIVEAYNVMRILGSSEDDLRVLVGKGLVTVLNDDLVSYINDWHDHNTIRADRKIDSIYQELLLRIVPDAQLTEKRRRSDLKTPLELVEIVYDDIHSADHGPSMDSKSPLKLSKDKLSKVSIIKDSSKVSIIKDSSKTIGDLFETLWALYPNKKGKGQISDAKKREICKIGEEEFTRAITRYKEDLLLEDWRKPQNGSTFFNSGHVDYLDKNYVPVKKESKAANNTTNKFNQFEQRSYSTHDYEKMEQNSLNRR